MPSERCWFIKKVKVRHFFPKIYLEKKRELRANRPYTMSNEKRLKSCAYDNPESVYKQFRNWNARVIMNIQNKIDKTWGQFMIENVIYIICVKFAENSELHIRDMWDNKKACINHLTQIFKDHFVLDGWAFRTDSAVIQFFLFIYSDSWDLPFYQ